MATKQIQTYDFGTAVTGEVSGTPTATVDVDGSAGAGSQHLFVSGDGLSDILTEQVRLVFTGNVTSLDITNINGQGAHVTPVMVTVNPGDDVIAGNRFLNRYPDVITILPNEAVQIQSEEDITDVYVLGLQGAGSTATSCVSTVTVEGFDYA